MAKAYVLNTTGIDLNVIVNAGGPQRLTAFIMPPGPSSATSFHGYDLVEGTNAGADHFGANTVVQVQSADRASVNYTVQITINEMIRPFTEDFQFLVFRDGMVGSQLNQFQGIEIATKN